MGRRARKCGVIALLDWFTIHTGLFNNSLLPLSDSFTVKALWHTYFIPLYVNEETEYLLGEKNRRQKQAERQSQKMGLLYFLRNSHLH